jgi:hypothetical protein
MKRAYEMLLRLYPRDYRESFASEMSSAFEEASRDRRARGWGAYARFAITELAGLAMGAGMEWKAKLTTDASVRGRRLPDRMLMRPSGVSWEAHYGSASRHVPEELRIAQQQAEFLVNRMVHAISHHDFRGARLYSDKERQARENLRILREKYQINN